MKRSSKKGFTLAELLIVIAIIAILIAVMFPVFGAQLDKARAAADLANVRATYSELVANAMLGDGTTLNVPSTITVKKSELQIAAKNGSVVAVDNGTHTVKVTYTGTTTIEGSFIVDSDVTLKDE